MEKIYIKHIVKGTSTNQDGFILKCKLEKYFGNNKIVYISFLDTNAISSSFFNSSFGELINKFGYQNFRNIIRPTDINKSQYELIKKYISWHLNNELA